MRVGGITHADVADGGGDENAFRAVEGTQHDLDGKLAAVLAPRRQLDSGADLLGQSFLGGAKPVCDQTFREALRNDVAHLLAEQLVAAIAELFLRLQIQEHDLALLVHHHHGVGRGFQQTPVPALHLHQMRVGGITHADVADGGGNENALRAAEGAQHDLDGKLAAVLAPRRQLDSGADLLGQSFLGGAKPVRDQAFREALRHDVAYLRAEQLVAAVAELFFRLKIQQHDLALLVHHHHGIGSRFQQTPVPALHLHQMRVGGITHADVANGGGDENPFRAAEGAQHDLDGKLAAVLAPGRQLDSGADLLGQSFLGGAKPVRDQAFREALRHDVAYLLAEQLVAAVAELFFRLQVQQHDLAVLVHHHHGIGSRFQQTPVPALHLHQMRFRRLAHADVADGRRYQYSV